MRALIVVIVALLSAPAFGENHMARNGNLGFGGAPMDSEFDKAMPSEVPPKPRARPKGSEQEEFKPLSQAERDKIFQRSLEQYENDPEYRERVLKKYEQILRLHSERPEEREI